MLLLNVIILMSLIFLPTTLTSLCLNGKFIRPESVTYSLFSNLQSLTLRSVDSQVDVML